MRKYLLYVLLCIHSPLTYANLIEITPESYVAQNDTTERRLIVRSIVDQFSTLHSNSISQHKIDKIWDNKELRQSLWLARFQIINQKLHADSFNKQNRYFVAIQKHLHTVITKYKIPDVDFIVFVRDEINPRTEAEKEVLSFPSFMMSKNLQNKYEKDKLLLPDAFMMDDAWGRLAKDIERSTSLYPWSEKIDKIYWRGGSTGAGSIGAIYDLEHFHALPRLSLVFLSLSYPDLIDARIVGLYEFDNSESSQKLKQVIDILFGGSAPFVKEVEHMQFKYLAAIDGNTCTWRRVPWIMLSNSVLVKQDTENVEWFYSAMKPYTHYVPLNLKLTNIFQQLEWMKSHDTEVRQISQNAQDFVKNNLMSDDIEAQTAIILNEYSKIQMDKVITPTLIK
jgi:protein glucosyltransferase